MDRLTPTLLIIAFLVVVFSLMLLGWRSRRRRQGGLVRPTPVPAQLGAASLVVDGWYVATTLADQPLERVAVHGLGFRARATASVHPEGLVLAPQGRAPFLIAAADLRGAGRATWAIDRVVEKDGLVLIGWMLGDTAVDSYLRVPDGTAAHALIDSLHSLVPAPDAEGPAS